MLGDVGHSLDQIPLLSGVTPDPRPAISRVIAGQSSALTLELPTPSPMQLMLVRASAVHTLATIVPSPVPADHASTPAIASPLRVDGQSHLSSIIDSAMDAIITVDDQQRVVMFNRSAARIFGTNIESALGSHLDRFIPERFRRVHGEHFRSFGQTGGTTRAMGRLGTLYGLRADGKEFPIEASISQAISGGRKLYTVILRDISERRLLEEQLIQSQKMEGIGRLAGGVAHDFNNLLTVIFGYLGVASSQIESDHRAQAALTHTREAADRAAKLTRQLLAFARKQIFTPRIFAVRDAVNSLVPMLRRLIGEDVTLDVDLAPGTGYVRADVGQFEQVIMNLTVNARDAMPSGGKLTIATRNIFLDEAYCRRNAGATPGEHVAISVTDTGVGMSPEVLERLFEPFFTTKGPGKGTGLGLATCHGVIRQSGGHIAVESEIGRGTSVRILLPREPEDALAALELKPNAPASGGSETILLVEDNAMVRDLVHSTLTRAGYRVLAAENGPRAIHLAADTIGSIDLLITDVVMPEMNGVRLAEAIQHTRPQIKILYMSGYTEETILRHGVESQLVAFLPKPFSIEALLLKIRSVLDIPIRTTL
ncbi:MAG TPA: ATP-binding protein [Phycisphaerales bacterium]|nr:ATP-binding protein [Phycisphaerales bacterium]